MNRPTSVTVFGVLNLVFGAFGFFASAVTTVMLFAGVFPQLHEMHDFPHSEWIALWTKVSMGLGLIGSLVLLASGLGLLLMKTWGRSLAVAYAMLTIVTTIAGIVLQLLLVAKPLLDDANVMQSSEKAGALFGAIGGMIGGGLGLIYPVLLWYFMTRPRVLAAFQMAEPAAPAALPGGWSSEATAGSVPQNPYSSPTVEAVPHWQGAPGGDSPDGNSIAETFIPSKNGPALASYYLGIFSLFPCLGFPMGVAAVYFGIQGLRRVRATPAVRGGAHAWVGLVCGGLFGLCNFLLILLMVFGLVASMQRP